jgi:pimeloyl-ACP methyl ester carboxylesterase
LYSSEVFVTDLQLTLLVVALLMGGLAILVFVSARAAERKNPPIGRFLEVDGVRLHYFEKGQGEPILLLHGNGTMIQDFLTSGVVDALSRSHRVLLFDRPGFGYSSRPRGRLWTPTAQARVIQNALRQLQVDRAVVVGHSWGTLVAIALALNHGGRVRSIVLLSGFYFPRFRFDALVLSPPAIPVIGDVLRYTIAPVLGLILMPLLLRAVFGPSPIPAPFAKEFPISLMLRPSQIRASAAEAGLMIPAARELRRRYHELTQPVLIMAGTDDRIVTTEGQSRRLRAELGNSEFREIAKTGHMVHHSVPGQVASAIHQAASLAPV